MAATDQDFTAHRGGSYVVRFTCFDEPENPGDPAPPLDLTNLDLYYRVAQSASSATPVASKDNGDIDREETDTPGKANRALVPLLTADTLEVPKGVWYHELYTLDAQGQRSVLGKGRLTMLHSQAAKHGASP